MYTRRLKPCTKNYENSHHLFLPLARIDKQKEAANSVTRNKVFKNGNFLKLETFLKQHIF